MVSNVVEDVYHGRPVDDFYRNSVENEYEISPTGNTWSVKWGLVGVYYVIGTSSSHDDVESIKRSHIVLREQFRDAPELEAVVENYRELARCEEDLRNELGYIANLAMFPGRCRLCNC